MSSQPNPLDAEHAHAGASSDRQSTPKRPYRTPELRALGPVAELTATSSTYVPAPDGAGYAS
jgi:hypothetical protein